MADPKYAGLPGIVTDQPDVYESTDLPESEQHAFHDALEDTGLEDAVEVLHISAEDAHSKFAGKYVDSDRVDFSDRISGRARTGYPSRRIEWAVQGSDGAETLVQRYHRLMCDVTELQGLLADQQEGGVAVDGDGDSSVVSAAALQKQVALLQQQLAKQRPAPAPAPASAPDTLQGLLGALKQAKVSGGAKPGKGAPTDGATQGLTYQVYCSPETAELGRAGQTAVLEQRLKRLEEVIGTQTEEDTTKLWQWTREGSVLGAVSSLGQKLALLEPKTLESVEGRLGGLAARLQEIRARGGDQQGAKVSELHATMQRCEELCVALPELVDRLAALQDLHGQAASFQQNLHQLQASQKEASKLLASNEGLLSSVAERFEANLSAVHSNVASLQQRLDKLQK